MVTLIDAVKAVDKNSTSTHTKTFQHSENRENISQHTDIFMSKLKSFPLRSGIRQGRPLLPLVFHMVLDVLLMASSQQKETKDLQVGKEEVELSLSADDMISRLKS